MNVPQEELDGWRALATRLKNAVYSIRIAPAPRREQYVEEAGHLAANLETRLRRAGADEPPRVLPSRPDVSLHLLDTPANRRYAEKLREAWEAGLAVDRERYGESIGTDGAAQVIEMVLAEVETEIYGPTGRLRE